MSAHVVFRIATLTKCITTNSTAALWRPHVLNRIQACGYAKKVVAKGKGKGAMKDDLNGPEVCKDPVKLTSYAVGVNIFKQGEDPKLKSPEEYPDWLFKLNLGAAKKLHELESSTWEYWRRLRKENMWRFNRLRKGKKF